MKHKIVAISLPQQQKWIKEWEDMIRNYPHRVLFYRNTELKYVSKEKELSYLKKLIEIETMMDTPSPANIIKLITEKDFLIRKLPGISYSNGYYTENHMAQFELICLIKNIKACWNQLSPQEIEQLTSFLIQKTNATLSSNAACFTISLKQTIDGLIEFQPQLEEKFKDIISKRKTHYANNPSE
jgi:hypothetical protein